MVAITVMMGLALSLFIATLVFIAYHTPQLAWVETLHLNDCELPCWIGIVPGKTSLDEARQHIREVFGDGYQLLEESYPQIEIINKVNGYGFTVYFPGAEHQPTIDRIQFYRMYDPRGYAPRVSELSPAISAPDSIRPDTQFTFLLYWKSQTMLATVHGTCGIMSKFNTISDRVPMRRVVQLFVVSKSLDDMQPTIGNRWRGFGVCHTIQLE